MMAVLWTDIERDVAASRRHFGTARRGYRGAHARSPMARLLALCLVGSAGLAALAGCANLGGPPLAPRDFALTLSEGGGFTGVETGVEVGRDGVVRVWGDAEALPVQSSDGVRDVLWNQLRGRFRATRNPGGSSLQRTIRVWAHGDVREARWAPGTEPDLDTLYDELWGTVTAQTRWRE